MHPAQNESEFPVGVLLDQRYEVLAPLGRGGCAVVYKVKQVLLNKEFALKSLNKDSINDASIMRFQREAKACFSLDHPSIIKVHDFGLTSEGLPFLVMELLQGETLADRIKRTGALPIKEAVDVMIQACFGLAYAHEHGVIHRDIKPSNIMVMSDRIPGSEGSIKIVDLGIAKFTQQDDQKSLTQTGDVFGSPLYMSPEQCSGLQTDIRTDVYSLGCVFFECLTGAPPIQGPDVLTTMMRHQTEEPPSLKEASLGREYPPALESIVAKMLAKDLHQRYQNLAEVVNDLGDCKRGADVSAAVKMALPAANKKKSNIESGVAIGIAASVLIFSFLALSFGALFLNSPRASSNAEVKPSPSEPSVFGQLLDTGLARALPAKHLDQMLQTAEQEHQLAITLSIVTVDNFKQIGACKALRLLSLEHCQIDNEGFKQLNHLPLKVLNVFGANVDNRGLELIKQLPDLEELNIGQTQVDEDGVSKNVCKMNNLIVIALDGLRITNEVLEKLAQLPRLKDLSLAECRAISPDGLTYLEKTGIRNLNLDKTFVDDKAVEYMTRMPSLIFVSIVDTRISAKGLELLCDSHSGLRKVKLSADKFNDPEFLAVMKRHSKVSFDLPVKRTF